MRTDFNLSDTGLISVSGSWQRAATLRETPMQFSLQWDRAQLGQATKLAYGNDKGWRGSLRVSTALTGTAANLSIVTAASIQDFRRYDILGGGELRLAAQCSGRYSSLDHALSDIACSAPVSDGAIAVSGRIDSPLSSRDYDLDLTVQNLPIQSVMGFVRHAKQGMPADLEATGRLNANVKLRGAVAGESKVSVWEGSGETTDFRAGSKLSGTELLLGRIPLTVASGASPKSHLVRTTVPFPSETRVEVGPFEFALGRPVPATVSGWASRSGYSFVIQGDAQVQRLLQMARMVGIPSPQTAAEGMAKLDLQIAGGWAGFAAPRAMGKAQLRSVRAAVRGLNAPLEIASANLLLTPEQVSVQSLAASIADTPWRGSLTIPRQCAAPGPCPIRFDLHADEIATDRWNELVHPQVRKQPWYHFVSSPVSGVPFLLSLHATGKIAADRAVVRKLAGNRVSANVELDEGKLRLSDLRADVLGGKYSGDWEVDFTAKPPLYSGSGTVQRVALDQLAKIMSDGWVTGSATATYKLSASGLTEAELLASATGTLKVEARDGLLRHVELSEGSGPLQMRRLAVHLSLREGRFEIQEGKLETPAGAYDLSGTASLTRALNLKLTREGGPGFNITGTLTQPHVSQVSTHETQAALKP